MPWVPHSVLASVNKLNVVMLKTRAFHECFIIHPHGQQAPNHDAQRAPPHAGAAQKRTHRTKHREADCRRRQHHDQPATGRDIVC